MQNPHLELALKALNNLKPNITRDDRLKCCDYLRLTDVTVQAYIHNYPSRKKDLATALDILKFFKERLAEREKLFC